MNDAWAMVHYATATDRIDGETATDRMVGKEQQWRGKLDGENSSAGTQTSRAFPMFKGQTFSLSTPVPSLHSTFLTIRRFLFPFVQIISALNA